MFIKICLCAIFLALNLASNSLAANESKNENSNKNKNNNDNNNQKREHNNEEIWQQDLTDTFKIEGNDQGIQKVNLKCGANSINVQLTTETAFTGVMYTRGSFYKQTAPCFVRPKTNNQRNLEMKFKFEQCQTLNDGDLYTNTIVVQNDPELITPGDAAFRVACDFRQARSLNVQAKMQTGDEIAVTSKITLTSPDPGADQNTDGFTALNSVVSDSDTVEYVPKHKYRPQNKSMHLGTVEEIKLQIEKDEL